MSSEDHDIELIEKYIDDTLTPEERSLFEKKINDDPTFAQEAKYHQSLFNALKEGRRKELKTEIRTIYDEVKKSSGNKKKSIVRTVPFRKIYAAAATVAVLFTVSVIWFQLSEPKHEQLFTTYYSPYPAESLTRGENDNKALEDYYNKKYEEAIPSLEILAKENPENAALHIVLGCTYLGANRPEEAVTRFEYASHHTDDTILLQHIAWYKALSLLKTNKKAEARKALEEIASENGIRKEDAEKLLEELK